MRRIKRLLPLLLAALLLAGAGFAQAPVSSLFPQPRPVARAGSQSSAAPRVSLFPRFRSVRANRRAKNIIQAAIDAVVIKRAITEDAIMQDSRKSGSRRLIVSPQAVARSLVPKRRPKNLTLARIQPRQTKAGKPVRYGKRGSVCGVRGIRGRTVSRVRGKIRGCGISNPVKVSEVDGVTLTREALIGCDAAKQLYSWVRKSAKPIIGRKGGGLAQIQLIAGYSCRTRNSRRGARLSEHAKGKAVDLAGFILKDGTILSVKRDWRSGPKGRTLKRLHKSACGPFGTVLGPNANRYHQDHFHFDVARYRGGAYCK